MLHLLEREGQAFEVHRGSERCFVEALTEVTVQDEQLQALPHVLLSPLGEFLKSREVLEQGTNQIFVPVQDTVATAIDLARNSPDRLPFGSLAMAAECPGHRRGEAGAVAAIDVLEDNRRVNEPIEDTVSFGIIS
jgi:hypothetical protein